VSAHFTRIRALPAPGSVKDGVRAQVRAHRTCTAGYCGAYGRPSCACRNSQATLLTTLTDRSWERNKHFGVRFALETFATVWPTRSSRYLAKRASCASAKSRDEAERRQKVSEAHVVSRGQETTARFSYEPENLHTTSRKLGQAFAHLNTPRNKLGWQAGAAVAPERGASGAADFTDYTRIRASGRLYISCSAHPSCGLQFN